MGRLQNGQPPRSVSGIRFVSPWVKHELRCFSLVYSNSLIHMPRYAGFGLSWSTFMPVLSLKVHVPRYFGGGGGFRMTWADAKCLLVSLLIFLYFVLAIVVV